MKIIIMCLTVILFCSCSDGDADHGSIASDDTMKKRNQVSRLMKEHYHSFDATFEALGPLTIAQIEQESLEKLSRSPRKDLPPVPFAFANDKWVELKGKYLPRDEFYYFTSDERSWANLCGIRGYVLVRKGEIVDIIVTGVN